jgi:predicted ester cyclase
MSKESTQAALGKFAEAVNTGKFELIDEVVAPECVDHDPAEGQVPGPDGYRFFFSGMRTAFPDLNVAAETVVQDGDSLAFAYTLTGTHNGSLGKIPPTGKKVKIREVQISSSKTGRWSNAGAAPTSSPSSNRSASSPLNVPHQHDRPLLAGF